MKTPNTIVQILNYFSITALAALLLAGCESVPKKSADQTAAVSVAPQVALVATVETMPARPTIRIKAGTTGGFTDGAGHVWLAEQGFTDGETTERPELTITGTTDQHIYQSEHYSMTQFAQALPNGKYIVKLHFCETFDGITGPGQRVFSFNVVGREFKDFDVWVKSGGFLRAYIETVPVEITDGKLVITFAPNIENPQINGIEIIPAP